MGNAPTRKQQRRLLILRFAAVPLLLLVTSAAEAQSTAPSQSQLPWSQDLQKYPGLQTELGQLITKLQHNVQFPPARGQSRLLPLLPESTVFYAAFPNYGDATHQALAIFRQELQESAVLRDWWQHGELAAVGPKLDDSVEKFYQLSQYLGEEIVVSGATEGHQDPNMLIVAEIRKPGLKNFLQQMMKDLAGKTTPDIRVLDVQELASATDTHSAPQLVVLVRPDLVVAATDLTALRSFNAHLDHRNDELASTPFGERLGQAYQGGAEVLAAADLQKIVKQIPAGSEQSQMIFQRTGFADVKYLFWEHKSVAGQAASNAELSFTGPRHGIASWLVGPARLDSLDFVSPKAILVTTVLLKNLGQIFEDIKDLSDYSNPNAFAALAQMEAAMKVSLRSDLLNHFGGEITLELDSVNQSRATWKAILGVNDPDHLQQTLRQLLAAAQVETQESNEGGVTYNTLRIPSPRQTFEISYAFVDGFLIIASSNDATADAVRIHSTGESLARSKAFLGSLPPGHLSAASALLYEDPIAVATLSMRQASPEMAQFFSQGAAQSTPVVICAYGEDSAIREASRSGGVDVGAILVGAAIAIPNLLRARIAANESSAAATIRTVDTAEITYSSTYPERGYARDLASLGPDPRGPNLHSTDHASMLDASPGECQLHRKLMVHEVWVPVPIDCGLREKAV